MNKLLIATGLLITINGAALAADTQPAVDLTPKADAPQQSVQPVPAPTPGKAEVSQAQKQTKEAPAAEPKSIADR